MKTQEERIKQLMYLIKRKDRIRAKHLLSIQKHLSEIKMCEEYIGKHKEELKKLSENLEF